MADEVANSREPLRADRPVITLSGIGNPGPFQQSLEAQFDVVKKIVLEDHHVYRVGDMRRLTALLERYPEAIVVTTEKDAVKMLRPDRIPAEVRRRLYYQPINISFIEDSAADFLQKLEKDVRKD